LKIKVHFIGNFPQTQYMTGNIFVRIIYVASWTVCKNSQTVLYV